MKRKILTLAMVLAFSLTGSLLAVPPPDPTTSTIYPCAHPQNLNWNYGGDGVGLVVGKVRFPTASCNSADGPPAGRPILIFAHGANMDNADHEYLMIHLAKNGFVTASIENSGDNEERALQMISYLNSMHTFWGWKTRLSDRVVFMGHSRGGEAAVTAARLLGDTPALGAENYDVRAVVSIAPTDGGGIDGNDPREILTGDATRGYLAIYGSHDVDVHGSHASQGQNLEPQKTAFAIYDRAGSESSSEGFVIAGTHVDKAFVFVYGMGHRVFLDIEEGPVFDDGTVDGQNVAKAYSNAFLRWKVLDQTDHRVFFEGTRPGSLAALELFQQLSAGQRRTVDNFQNGNLAVNAMGDDVVESPAGILTFLEDNLHELIKSSPHATGGVRVTWVAPSSIRWDLPNSSPIGVGPLRDVTDYTHLSFRVAQVYGNTYNTEDQDQDFHVRLYTSAGYSNKVRVSLHGRIPYPDEFQCPDASCGQNPPNDFSKSPMNTVRVPLAAFSNVNLSDVRYVYFYFDVPERPSGAITLDSLEFVQ